MKYEGPLVLSVSVVADCAAFTKVMEDITKATLDYNAVMRKCFGFHVEERRMRKLARRKVA